jgi:hypothetical protein
MFDYLVLYDLIRTDEISNLIVFRHLSGRPLEAVMYSGQHRKWVFAPSTAAAALYYEMYEDLLKKVDRATAERVAMERFGVPLPSEAEIDQICLAKSPNINDPA